MSSPFGNRPGEVPFDPAAPPPSVTSDWVRVNEDTRFSPPGANSWLLLVLGSDDFVIELSRRPNAWWRFWQWVFFGFRYERP